MKADPHESIRPNKEQEMITYPPSWFDKFSNWVDQLPGQNWAYYLGIGVFLFIVGAIIQWRESSLRTVEFLPISIIALFQIVYMLSLLDFLGKRAERSLEEFRPILKVDDSQYLSLKTRLTTLPSRPIMLITILVALFFTGFGFAVMNSPMDLTTDNSISIVGNMFRKSPGPEFSTLQDDGLRFSNWVAALAAYITSIINKLNP